ncbi:uncharacterized protein [Littorina saxatilis]|uniref:uncharacterized protein n=1 Tax=Littorina saxatilis TaxID=31220 RepID=UPI0038B5E29E
MRLSASSVLVLFAVMLGMCRVSNCCNTNKETCDTMMSDAMNLPTAEEKCSAMEQYLTCVQNDIEDCEGNSFTDQYALNMVSSYCNKAYLCSDSLQRCYQNFTQSVLDTITNSNNDTRAQLCGSLVTPIMTCQERVTADCDDQTGLLETVANKQESIKAACSNTLPCLGKILQCQSSIMDMVPGEGDEVPAQNQPTDCSAQKPVNYCGAYQTALNCMQANLTACTGKFKVDSIVASMANTTATVCNPQRTCMEKISSCLCHINSQGSQGHASIYTSVCTTYPPFAGCLDGLGPVCGTNEYVNTQSTALKSSYKEYHTLFCTKEGGLCPAAVQCMANLSLPQAGPQSSKSSQGDDLSISNLCLSAQPVLQCLGSASTECGEKEGNVTFKQIEDNFLDMCIEIGPHVQTLSTCASFSQCMKNFDLFDLGVAVSSGTTQDALVKVMQQMYSGLTKTDFWCSYLSHGYKCVADGAQGCSLGDEFAAESQVKYSGIQVMCGGGTPAPPPSGVKPAQPPPSRTGGLLPKKPKSTTGNTQKPGNTNVGGAKDTDDNGNGVSSLQTLNTTTLLAAVTSIMLLLRHQGQ